MAAEPRESPFAVLRRHHDPASPLYEVLVVHSVLVAQRAVRIAEEHAERNPGCTVDLRFLEEAALLHDIGIGQCSSPGLPSTGTEPYIRHGVIGRAILEAEGLPRHALVCERHVGSGIPREEVLELGLPIPPRDYLPVSLEEKIICVADKFYSKSPGKLWKKKKLPRIEESLAKHGPGPLLRWRALRAEILGE